MTGIDRLSDRPAYLQLADLLRAQIVNGELKPGTPLPAEKALSKDFDMSSTSVKQAVAVLRNEGLIVSGRGQPSRVRPIRLIGPRRYQRGKGNYDDATGSAFAEEHGVNWSEFDLTRQYSIVPAVPRVAGALGVPTGADVYERQFTHATGGIMLRLSHSYLRVDRFADTVLTDPDEPLWPGGTIAQLYSLGIDVTRVEMDLAARAATDAEAHILKLAARTPVLEYWRTQFAGDDAVEIAQHVYPSDRQRVVVDFPVGAARKRMEGWAGPAPD